MSKPSVHVCIIVCTGSLLSCGKLSIVSPLSNNESETGISLEDTSV